MLEIANDATKIVSCLKKMKQFLVYASDISNK